MNTTKRVKLSPQEKDAIYALPLDVQFVCIYTDPTSGCSVYQHVLVDTSRHFSPHNINHLGNLNYIQNQIHWFVGGIILKLNRPKRTESLSACDTTN